MNHSWTSIIVTAGLIILLTVFAGSQYYLLRQNSEAVKEQMQRRVENDTKRMAEELGLEIQSLFLTLQGNEDIESPAGFARFAERILSWKEGSQFPGILGKVYFIPNADGRSPVEYDHASQRLMAVDQEGQASINKVRDKISNNENPLHFIPADLLLYARLIDRPSLPEPATFNVSPEGFTAITRLSHDNFIGDLVVLLDRNELESTIFPELYRRYFPDNNYHVSVIGKNNDVLFDQGNAQIQPDANVPIDAKAPILASVTGEISILATRSFEIKSERPTSNSNVVLKKVEITHGANRGNEPRIAITRNSADQNIPPGIVEMKINGANVSSETQVVPGRRIPSLGEPYWNLSVQHTDGSIGKFVDAETDRNLMTGLLVYLLLVGSVLTIVISSIRSKQFAQRQVDFVSSVSHEFRTPLAVIYSAGENLADGVAKDAGQVELYGNLVKNEGKKLSAMVEHILEFAGAKNGARRFNFANAELSEILNDSLADLKPLIEEKDFQFEINIDKDLGKINADKEALSGAIQNLVMNAVKYSNGTRSISFNAFSDQGKAVISVEDKGIGIKTKDLRHIFKPFYRSREVVDAQIHGNGLGLSLVKDVVEAHHGNIRAESELGKGSRFIIELPI